MGPVDLSKAEIVGIDCRVPVRSPSGKVTHILIPVEGEHGDIFDTKNDVSLNLVYGGHYW